MTQGGNELLAAVLILVLINLIVTIVMSLRTKDHEKRLTTLEVTIRYMPKEGDLRAMREAFNDLRILLSEETARTETIATLLKSVQEHLLERER